MGKHDKQDTTFSWQPMPNEWYEARIKQLEDENRKLNKEIEALEYKEEMLKGCIGELKSDMDDLIADKERLEKAVLRAALREVE